MTPAVTLGTAVCAAVLTAVCVIPARRVALRLRLTGPTAGRGAHRDPIPHLGGAAILIGALLPVAGATLSSQVRALLIGALLVALLGLVGDVRTVGVLPRLLVVTGAATIAVLNGVRADLTGTWADVPLTIVWIVIIAGAFSRLDNLDGVFASIALVTGSLLSAAALTNGHEDAALLALALACACGGFLVHNWSPATISMGGCGSLFIGFTLAAGAVVVFDRPGQAGAGLLLTTFVATVDLCAVVIARHRAKRPLLRDAADHVAHRLVRAGVEVPGVAALLGGCALLSGGFALSLALGALSPALALGVSAAAVLILAVTSQPVRLPRTARPAYDRERPARQSRR